VWLLVLSTLSLCTWPHALCFPFEIHRFGLCSLCQCRALLSCSDDTSSHQPRVFEGEHAHPRALASRMCAAELDPTREIPCHATLPSRCPVGRACPPSVCHLSPRSHHEPQEFSGVLLMLSPSHGGRCRVSPSYFCRRYDVGQSVERRREAFGKLISGRFLLTFFTPGQLWWLRQIYGKDSFHFVEGSVVSFGARRSRPLHCSRCVIEQLV